MISIEKKDCCGCESCAQVCPFGCIEMVADKEGFKYPKVDTKKCTNCHLCEKSCPSVREMNKNENVPENKQVLDSFFAQNKGDERLESSSGGIFALLANKILSEGGVIFGAAFDENWSVQHTECKSADELHRLMGSKYVQSRANGSFVKTEEYLQAGKKVLYTGTACQIAGLKAFLGREYDNLYTVDVLCHGVPSPKVWDLYVKELSAKYSSEISRITFRDKSLGWHKYSFRVDFKNGDTYSVDHSFDPYMNLFVHDFILRPSCHSCKYKEVPRLSDITIGDAWGIESMKPEMDDDRGTSVILCNSQKGKELIKDISISLNLDHCGLDSVFNPRANSKVPVPMAKGRRLCFLYLKLGKSMDVIHSAMDYSFKSRVLRNLIRNK